MQTFDRSSRRDELRESHFPFEQKVIHATDVGANRAVVRWCSHEIQVGGGDKLQVQFRHGGKSLGIMRQGQTARRNHRRPLHISRRE